MMGKRAVALSTVLAVLLVSCGTGALDRGTDTSGTATAETTTTEATTTTSTTIGTTTTTEPDLAATSLNEARDAVVRIRAQGTFVDPESGSRQVGAPGGGSGFIIDESGLIVTNNHVVTGAALIEVYLEGEQGPRHARILGVSECYDLAVIQLDTPGGHTYLEWRQEPVEAGMPIYALGYPLGDPEYTVYDGVIAKEDRKGATRWAAVESVIEHSADTLGGNSGGPVIDEQARVLGVNYAGNNLGQAFAIGADVASAVVETLAAGKNLDGLGVNGEAWWSESGETTGIWVASVETGSAADRVGIKPGDIIVELENHPLAEHGTMSEYCDILRTHGADEPMKVKVARWETGELLEGTINGPELEVILTVDDDTTVEAEPEAGTEGAGEGGGLPTGYEYVYDETDTIVVAVPTAFTDRAGGEWTQGEGPAVSASPDLDGFWDSFTVPGVFVGASRKFYNELGSAEAFLAERDGWAENCADVDTGPYTDAVYEGEYELWFGCGDGGEAILLELAVQPIEAPDHIVFVIVQESSAADEGLITAILDSFWARDY